LFVRIQNGHHFDGRFAICGRHNYHFLVNPMTGKSIKRLSELTGLMLLTLWINTALGEPDGDGIAKQLSFGRVMPDQPVEQVVKFDNPTSKKLTVEYIQLTPPLAVRNITPVIEPGGQGQFTLVLGEKRGFGKFEGGIQINFENNDTDPLTFSVEGFVVPPVEFKPRPVFFVATHRGEDKQASIDIINHRTQPLNILRVESQSNRFDVDLETLSPGQKYRLTLSLRGSAPAGKETGPIRLITDEASGNDMTIQANTLIRERIYTFPESIDMGSLPIDMLKDQSAVAQLAQTLMVYRLGTEDFRITASTDLDSIQLQSERGPMGDRFELTVTLVPDKIQPGELNGTIYLKTNDAEFPELVVPITGSILTQ
jgi:hypothetical protein